MAESTLTPADRAFIEGARWASGHEASEESLPAHRARWDQSRIYYEAHVTLTPLDEREQKVLRFLLSYDGGVWRQARFDMITGGERPSAFLSTRSTSLLVITQEVRRMVEVIGNIGLRVTRWKIEDTLMDSSRGDVL